MRETEDEEAELMHHRQVVLEDGRYMIVYTFGDAEPNTGHESTDPGEDV